MATLTPERSRSDDRLTSLVGVPVVAPHSLRHLQCAVSVLAREAGLREDSTSRLQADCRRLVSDLMARSPEGGLVMLRILRPGSGLEVTVEYGPTPQEPLGGRLTASVRESAA